MSVRTVLSLSIALLVAMSCGGASAVAPTAAPSADPTVGLAVPDGPVLFEPEQIIFPPEEFPLAGAEVARDAPLTAHGWERQFALPASVDFRWFTLRLFVLDPDIGSSRFIEENGCGSVAWPGERTTSTPLDVPRAGDGAVACRYVFADGQRVLYYTTGYRNVGMLIGTQPKRAEMTDALASAWLAALARQQIAIIGRVLEAYPPPALSGR